MTREVTEQDFRAPEFVGAKVEDYEFRPDGKLVRKDRWETGFRELADLFGVGPRDEFEIPDVVRTAQDFIEKVNTKLEVENHAYPIQLTLAMVGREVVANSGLKGVIKEFDAETSMALVAWGSEKHLELWHNSNGTVFGLGATGDSVQSFTVYDILGDGYQRASKA